LFKLNMSIVILAIGSLTMRLNGTALDGPVVASVEPLSQTMSAEVITPIVIRFDRPVDPQTIDGSTVKVFGRWSGVASGQFQMEENNTQVRFVPSTPFFAGEWVTVSCSKRVQSQDGVPMAAGYAWNFWIRTAAGSLDLREIAQVSVRQNGEGRIQTYGAYAGDLDGDGYSDFVAPNERSDDVRVFLNDGSGRYSGFTIYGVPNGAAPSTNEGADFNGDGIIDLAVGNSQSDTVSVFMGDGNGGFFSVTNYHADLGVRGLSVLDLEGDGDADIVTANRVGSNISILENNGDGLFLPTTNVDANGDQETACATADANGDGILDLFVGALGSNEMILLLGDGQGGFEFHTKVDAGGSPWMIAVGDVNGDGRVDVVSANAFEDNAAVILGDRKGDLLPAVTYPVGVFPIAIDLGDLDGDGDLDLVTSNFSSRSWTIYENAGDGTFINPRTFSAGSAGSCAVLHDRDNDGDLDMTGIDEIDDLLFLFENNPEVQSVADDSVPERFRLLQNYPNPFNPVTTVQYEIPRAAHVTLRVYDVTGRQVAVLVDEEQRAGSYTVHFSAGDPTSGLSSGDRSGSQQGDLSTGIYFYRITADDFSATKKLLLLK